MALEEKGQSVIVRYLKGDQVPQLESEFVQGERLFKAALELAPDAAFDESRFLFCRGRAEIFKRQYTIAQRTLDAAINIDPERAYAYNAIGIAYLEQIPTRRATFDQAATAFRTAIRFAPYWAYPRHNLALTYAEAGKFTEAITIYEHARSLAPSYSYLPYNLGLLYEQINETSAARRAYTDALQLAQKDCSSAGSAVCSGAARAYTALGVLCESLGKDGQAEKQYLSALQNDPNLMDAKHDLASMWIRLKKQPARAEQMWRENLRAEPNHIPSLIGLSDLLLKTNRPNEALPLYERLLTLRQNYGPAVLGIANIHIASSDPRGALAILDRKRDVLKGNPEFWIARTRAHLALHDVSAARADYAKALDTAATGRQRRAIKKDLRDRL